MATAGWFDFSGTIGRMTFLGRTIAAWLIPVIVLIWAIAQGGSIWLLFVVTLIGSWIVTLAAYVDRLRDMGAHPILVILLFVPVANFGLWIACLLIPGVQPRRA